ncbi:hypothetical protein ACOMHN_049811 [Nucella lapillus]
MWLKLCLLLIYIIVLFLLARLVEALTWYETGSLSRRLLDPMTVSVAKLKALLEQRGVSYDTVVEKAELTQLVEGSVHEDEVEMLQSSEDAPVSANTNFTSGAHFYEQVEDAKDSVWLVQVIAQRYEYKHHRRNRPPPLPMPEVTWKSLRKKITKFGVHTGVLDCELDPWWCERRGWHSSHLLLALPQVYEQKANVATYTYQGPLRQNAVSHWIRQKLHEKIETIQDFRTFKNEWLTFKNAWQESEVRALLFTNQDSIPMFFSALSVKFPGRVRFGVVSDDHGSALNWAETVLPGKNLSLPLYVLLTSEGPYMYGKNQGDCLTFNSMETLLKFLHPCLNDIFIFSFLMANMVSMLEFFIAQGGVGRRSRRCLWCVVKYNAAVIMLWLPLIAIFQLPYLDHIPLFGLKASRLLATSPFGEAFRRDFFYFVQHPYMLVASFLSACAVFAGIAYKVTGGRYEEDNEPWFNFTQMRTLTHLRSNEFFEPMFMSGYELSGLGSRLYLPTMSLQPVVSHQYIGLLPTWPYCSKPVPPAPLSSSPRGGGSSGTVVKDSLSQDACSHTSLAHMAGPANQEHHPQPYVTATASASDLLDGNYHCECQQFVNPQQAATNTHYLQASESAISSEPEAVPSQLPSQLLSAERAAKCTNCKQNPLQPSSARGTTVNSPVQERDESEQGAAARSSCSVESSPAEWLDFPDGYLPSSQCVICLEDFSVGVLLCGLPCGHVFHHTCILTWLKRDHHFCPVCRWPSFRPKPAVVHCHSD